MGGDGFQSGSKNLGLQHFRIEKLIAQPQHAEAGHFFSARERPEFAVTRQQR